MSKADDVDGWGSWAGQSSMAHDFSVQNGVHDLKLMSLFLLIFYLMFSGHGSLWVVGI